VAGHQPSVFSGKARGKRAAVGLRSGGRAWRGKNIDGRHRVLLEVRAL
jgi:hypothetical protein